MRDAIVLRTFGMLLLIVGVILAASAGIQLGDAEYDATVEAGAVVLGGETMPADAAPVPAATRLSDWVEIGGAQFLLGLVLLAVGATMGRVALGRDGAEAASADGQDFTEQLMKLADAIEEARDRLGGEHLDATRARIEGSLQHLVLPMIDARAALQRRFGLGGAALVIGPLSGAERQLNRAWSTLVDGHAPEAATSLAAAAVEVELAQQALEDLHGGST